MHCSRFLALALFLLAGAASAGDVVMYRASDTPDPRALAAILSRPPLTRGIRMLQEPQPAAADSAAAEPESAPEPVTAVPAERPVVASSSAPRERPIAAAASAPASADSFAMPVPFAFDSARILAAASVQLDAVVAAVRMTPPDVHVLIEGHTDGIGSAEYNRVLSERRAESVKAYLVAHGIEADRLHTLGMGKSMPLRPADPNAAENRRVQFRALEDTQRMAGGAPRRS